MSLYRVYRPLNFGDVAGQEHIVTTLQRAMEQGQLSHAYLFAGQRGTGKTSIARILAKAILTRGVEDAKIREQIVKAAEEGNLVDLMEIDAASNTGVDDIRALIEKIQFSPVVAMAKVYIIDEAHMLSKSAFNALLKTLEEPPPYAYFILATTELHKIPMTIQSRCQRYLFRQIREEDIISRLEHVAKLESIVVDREALRAMAHHVQGSLRDALSLLDQLRSLVSITAEDVRHRIGETGHEYVEQMFAAIRSGDQQEILRLTRAMEENAVPLENFLRLMLTAVREELHTAIGAKRDTAPCVRMLDVLLQALRDLRSGPVPGLVLESALLSLCSANKTVASPSPVVSKPLAPPVERIVVSKPVAAPETIAAHTPDLTFETLRAQWQEIVAATEPASVRMSLKNGHVHTMEGGVLRLSFTSTFHREKVASIEASRAIEAAVEKCFKHAVKIECLMETEVHASQPALVPDEVVDLAEVAGEVF